MPSIYFWALVHSFANDHLERRGMWRLSVWAMRKMLRPVQKYSTELSLTGPIIIENQGTIEIGRYTTLRSSWHKPISFSVTSPQGRLLIEDQVFINWGVNIGVASQVVIGARSLIGDDALIYDTDWHSLDGTDNAVETAPTRIGRGVWLSARTVVLRGVTIGDNTVVAANSVVTSDLPNNVLAAGAPARIIRTIDRRRFIETE